jgi:hypothetical protein
MTLNEENEVGRSCSTQGRLRFRCEGNIGMDLREMGWNKLNASGSGWGPVAGFCGHGNELPGSKKKCKEFLA